MLQLTRKPMIVLEGMRNTMEENGVIGLAIWEKRTDIFEIWQEACQTIDPSYTNGTGFDDPCAWRTTEELSMYMEGTGFGEVMVEYIMLPSGFVSTDTYMQFGFNANNPATLLHIKKRKDDPELARAAVKKVCQELYGDGNAIKLQAGLGVGKKLSWMWILRCPYGHPREVFTIFSFAGIACGGQN